MKYCQERQKINQNIPFFNCKALPRAAERLAGSHSPRLGLLARFYPNLSLQFKFIESIRAEKQIVPSQCRIEYRALEFLKQIIIFMIMFLTNFKIRIPPCRKNGYLKRENMEPSPLYTLKTPQCFLKFMLETPRQYFRYKKEYKCYGLFSKVCEKDVLCCD